MQTENDQANNDINTEVGNNTLLHGRSINGSSSSTAIQKQLGITATGYTIDTTGAHLGTIKINYNGAENDLYGYISLTMSYLGIREKHITAYTEQKIEQEFS